MQAVRKNRYVILPKDFEKAYKKVVKKRDQDFDFYKWDSLSTFTLNKDHFAKGKS